MTPNTKRKPLIATALLLTSLGVTTSCIDNSYNLNKDIDMTVNVDGEHLAIPAGYMEQITLDKIVELDEGDDLQLVNREYHLLKLDKIDETNTSVKMVTVNASSNPINSIKVVNDRTYPQPEDATVEDVESEGSVNTEAHGADEAVIGTDSSTANAPAKLTLSFEINKTSPTPYSDATIDKMTIAFPDFIKFEEGQSGLDGQVLTISNKTSPSSTYTIDLCISKYVFGEKHGDGNKVREENGDRIIKIENQKITVKTDATAHQVWDTGSLSTTPIAIPAVMIADEVNGTAKPDTDVKPTEAESTSLPDFLQDEGVKSDITNPVFSFRANNPLNEEIETDGIMTGYKNGRVTKTVKIGSDDGGVPIKLKPSGNKQWTISVVHNEKIVIETGATKVIVPNLNDIIETIPDRISVELRPTAKTDDYYTVNLGQDYVLNSKYNIDIPLSFDSGLKIVYEETIDDFDLDLGDVDTEKAIISVTADNTTPLRIEIKNENVGALDVNGNKIIDINATVEGIITESRDGESIVASQLNISLVSTKEDVINKLDGLFFKVTVVPGQAADVQLLSSQWIQLKGMKLKTPNGIKVDLN